MRIVPRIRPERVLAVHKDYGVFLFRVGEKVLCARGSAGAGGKVVEEADATSAARSVSAGGRGNVESEMYVFASNGTVVPPLYVNQLRSYLRKH